MISSHNRTALTVVAMGIALRAAYCVRQGPPAGDELMLAMNVAARGYAELMRPLDYGLVAPIPFLWAQRLVVDTFGVCDTGPRVIPFLAGSLTLVVLWRLVTGWLASLEALAALALAATSPFLIQYSAEGKPYALDGLASVVVAAAAIDLLGRATDGRAWGRMAMAGSAALLVSITSPMVLAPVTIVLVSVAWPDGSRGRLRLVAMGALWGVIFTAVYLGVYHAVETTPYMQQYWSAAMLSPGPRWAVRWASGVREALWPVSYWTVQAGAWWLVLLACAAGALILFRRFGWRPALVLAGPIVTVFLASAAGRYPMATRLLLFVAPLFIVLAAVGVAAAARGLRRVVPSVREGLAVGAIMAPSFLVAFAWLIRAPQDHQGLPELISQLERRWSPGEPVYVFHRVAVEWTYFTTDWGQPDRARLAWVARIAGPSGPAFVNAPPRGPRHEGEGNDLVYRVRGRDELFGLASGVQGRAWLALDPRDLPDWQVSPDSGWAQVEAARLRRAATSRAWAVFNTDSPGREIGELLAAIGRAGGAVESRRRSGSATLYSLRFDVAGAPAAHP
ncbi:MAG: glycosyltransferase family 39 protein [Gemmatimonadales bacterium]